MSEGIVELKEVIVAIDELAIECIKHLKGGLQGGKALLDIFSDVMANEDLKAKFIAAGEGIMKVPAEAMDLDLSEIIDLSVQELQYIPKVIDAIKSQA